MKNPVYEQIQARKVQARLRMLQHAQRVSGNGSTNNNRMDGYSYESAGNLLNDGTHQYFYDAENHLIQVDGTAGICTSGSTTGTTACYYYDAEGHRVWRTGYTADSCDSTGKRGYLFDLAGHVIVENNSNGTGCQGQVYVGERHFGRQSGGTFFYHADWLGTVRFINSDGYPTQGAETCTSLPFGDGLSCNSTYGNVWHFTGKERDYESGLDNFGARYDSSNFGRFMSVDPIWVKADRMLDPQRLNLYAYARNNPLKFLDPSGMDVRLGNCPGTMTISMCEAAVTNGLTKADRGHVHFVEGDGKNGYQKGETAVLVDKDYSSTSKNFQNLQTAANDHSATAVFNFEQTGFVPQARLAYQTRHGDLIMADYASVFKATFGTPMVLAPPSQNGTQGLTAYQLWDKPVAWGVYSYGSNTQVYALADSALEMSINFYHELVHVVLADFGRNVGAGVHNALGVNAATDAAQAEAAQNAKPN